jgi:hypothetical protein
LLPVPLQGVTPVHVRVVEKAVGRHRLAPAVPRLDTLAVGSAANRSIIPYLGEGVSPLADDRVGFLHSSRSFLVSLRSKRMIRRSNPFSMPQMEC